MTLLERKPKVSRLLRIMLACGLFVMGASSVVGQTRTTLPDSKPQATPEDKRDDMDFSSRESEMRTRLILKEEKKAYEQHVARAKEARELATDLKLAYETHNAFTSQDQKKLERLEKLARRIRNEAGGSDTDADPKDLPQSIGSAVKLVAEMAEDLCKEVEKTPRRVVSASIIAQANKLIGLIQHVRDTSR
jgi:vacuolar-type H+-ATPase subunit I/STV1